MYNWVVQDAIVAFVDSLKPQFGAQADLYQYVLGQIAMGASNLLTSLGYPPVFPECRCPVF